MAFDVDLSGKAILIAIVLLLTAFFGLFAPSLIIVAVIFLVLGLLAYLVWIVGVRINRRLTGRRGGLR